MNRLSTWGWLLSASIVWADFAPPQLTPSQKTSNATIVVVGTITDVDAKPVAASGSFSEQQQDHTLVTIKVTENLVGAAGLTQVRVGLAPLNLGPRRGQFPIEGIAAKKGQTACFFLMKHPKEDFLVLYPWAWPLNDTTPTYKKDLDEVRQTAKTIDDPLTALRHKDAKARMQAAQMLLLRYNTVPHVRVSGQPKQENLSAEESKLLLLAVKEMPYNAPFPQPSRGYLWYQLRLTEADGWKQPTIPAGVAPDAILDEATKKWLDKNADTAILKRYVR